MTTTKKVSAGDIDKEDSLRRTLHVEHSKIAWDAIQSSSDEYDKGILTMSSAMLALSLAFMKDIVPRTQVVHRFSLYLSWGCFALSVLTVICSFRLSIPAHYAHLRSINDYYLGRDDKALSRKNRWGFWVEISNWISGFTFLAGILSSVYFVTANLWR